MAVDLTKALMPMQPVSQVDSITKALSVVSQLPQTQADINRLAATAQYTQTPEFKAQLETAEKYAVSYAAVSLALQGVLTLVSLMSFLVLLRREDRQAKESNPPRKRRK